MRFSLCLVVYGCCFVGAYHSLYVSYIPSNGIKNPLGLFFSRYYLKVYKRSMLHLSTVPLRLPWKCKAKRLFCPPSWFDPTNNSFYLSIAFLSFFRHFHTCLISSSQGVKFQGQTVLCIASWLLGFLALTSQCATEYWTWKLNRNFLRSYFYPRQWQLTFSYNLFFL